MYQYTPPPPPPPKKKKIKPKNFGYAPICKSAKESMKIETCINNCKNFLQLYLLSKKKKRVFSFLIKKKKGGSMNAFKNKKRTEDNYFFLFLIGLLGNQTLADNKRKKLCNAY